MHSTYTCISTKKTIPKYSRQNLTATERERPFTDNKYWKCHPELPIIEEQIDGKMNRHRSLGQYFLKT
jgi:hypothetical protein